MKVILLLLCGRLILYAFLAVRFWKLVAFRCQCPKPVEGKNNNDCVCCIDIIDFRSERGLPSGSLLLLIRCEPSSRQQGSHCFPFQCCGAVFRRPVVQRDQPGSARKIQIVWQSSTVPGSCSRKAIVRTVRTYLAPRNGLPLLNHASHQPQETTNENSCFQKKQRVWMKLSRSHLSQLV
jgi:hypothetical protein